MLCLFSWSAKYRAPDPPGSSRTCNIAHPRPPKGSMMAAVLILVLGIIVRTKTIKNTVLRCKLSTQKQVLQAQIDLRNLLKTTFPGKRHAVLEQLRSSSGAGKSEALFVPILFYTHTHTHTAHTIMAHLRSLFQPARPTHPC